MLTITRRTRKASCSGFRATTIWIVEQFGLAMIPLCLRMSRGLTSGTTSGTSGSIRQALELSTTTAPAFAAIGLYCFETEAGVLDRTMSIPAKVSSSSGAIVCVLPRNVDRLAGAAGRRRGI